MCKLFYSQVIRQFCYIIWPLFQCIFPEICKLISGLIQCNNVDVWQKRKTGNEAPGEPGPRIAMEHEHRMTLGIAVFSIAELPAVW